MSLSYILSTGRVAAVQGGKPRPAQVKKPEPDQRQPQPEAKAVEASDEAKEEIEPEPKSVETNVKPAMKAKTESDDAKPASDQAKPDDDLEGGSFCLLINNSRWREEEQPANLKVEFREKVEHGSLIKEWGTLEE
ncbi:hypothetical protein CDD80_3362 [Ophiocordyceps camponoti-rufipedis]|uniref:Uncharacterized protein n=1 Tax=Ophiocordyceps camponoti-rufipedis TaxID=2004952 RepID=A0A2C5ZMP6_9HYPO|nr:hypothetical protein CDD80_3362 [Ophiocordyceps camponoti-rufipedis]